MENLDADDMNGHIGHDDNISSSLGLDLGSWHQFFHTVSLCSWAEQIALLQCKYSSDWRSTAASPILEKPQEGVQHHCRNINNLEVLDTNSSHEYQVVVAEADWGNERQIRHRKRKGKKREKKKTHEIAEDKRRLFCC